MTDAGEIVYEVLEPVPIPATKPPTELVDGRLVQKTGGERAHQALEKRWVAALDAWAGHHGRVLHEWRHQFHAPGHSFASLVPDVAYLPHETLDTLGPDASETPPCAPDIAVEVLSLGDSQDSLGWKIGAYLAAGTSVLFVVDPLKRKVTAHSRNDVKRFGPGETVMHPLVPGFAYAVDSMFEGCP